MIIMGRQTRQDFDFAFHHVMNRAGARRWVFKYKEHYHEFFDVMKHVVETEEIEVHAYCLMGNHYHLLLRTPHQNLSKAMHKLGSMFTKRFNRMESIDGPLFKSRFKSIIVGNDEYLRQLCRYIHRNPVKAGLTKLPQEYEWSSYRALIGLGEPQSWLTCDELPNYFAAPNLKNMRAFVETHVETDMDRRNLDELFKSRDDTTDSGTDIPIPNPSRCIAHQSERRDFVLGPATLNDIIIEIRNYFGLPEDALFVGKAKVKNMPRDLSILLAREETQMKVSDVGRAFAIGPTQASNAIARAKNRIFEDENIRYAVKLIREAIRNRRPKIAPNW